MKELHFTGIGRVHCEDGDCAAYCGRCEVADRAPAPTIEQRVDRAREDFINAIAGAVEQIERIGTPRTMQYASIRLDVSLHGVTVYENTWTISFFGTHVVVGGKTVRPGEQLTIDIPLTVEGVKK